MTEANKTAETESLKVTDPKKILELVKEGVFHPSALLTVGKMEHQGAKKYLSEKMIERDKLIEEWQEWEDRREYKTKYDAALCNARLEALKIATDIALKINHFEPQYTDGMPGLLRDIDLLHEIADHNLKYIMGE